MTSTEAPRGRAGLGLRRGTIVLAPHDPAWRAVFDDAAAAILERTGLPAARVQHVGSTAVPGLIAKPILDVAIGAGGAQDVERLARQLVELGYIDRGLKEGSAGRLLVRESDADVRTIHVHIVQHATQHWDDYVAFRDALRADASLRDRYAALKRALYARYSAERTSYTNGKAEFIREVVAGRVAEEPRSPDRA